jgi:hypothetical protein
VQFAGVTLPILGLLEIGQHIVPALRLRWVIWLMNLNVFARFVPAIVVMIPLYVTFRQLGLLNSVWGVIIALTGFLLPYGVAILAPYFAASARVDSGKVTRRKAPKREQPRRTVRSSSSSPGTIC